MVEQRPLYDVGRLAVAITGQPLAAYLNHIETNPDERTTARALRDDARPRPLTRGDADIAAIVRTLAWTVIFLAGAGSAVLVGVVGALVPSLDLVTTVLAVVMVGGFLFAGMSLAIQVGRVLLLRYLGEHAFPGEGRRGRSRGRGRGRAGARPPAPPNRFVRWLCTPSWFDAVPALLFAALVAPHVISAMS